MLVLDELVSAISTTGALQSSIELYFFEKSNHLLGKKTEKIEKSCQFLSGKWLKTKKRLERENPILVIRGDCTFSERLVLNFLSIFQNFGPFSVFFSN